MPPSYRLDPRACPRCLRPRSTLALDRAPASPRSAFLRAMKVERDYASRLRKVARHIGDLVREFGVVDLASAARAGDALRRYARTLTPWAEAVSHRMVTEVAARDERSWFRVADQMGKALKDEIRNAPTGQVLRTRMADQVRLITSLPTEAAERVHERTLEGITKGWRTERIAKEIAATGDVSRSRADLIARTEVSRTATELTKARAEHVGSTHFIWRSVGDASVRPTHQALNGRVFRWDDPPECDSGHRALPGCIWNCRCFAEPVIGD